MGAGPRHNIIAAAVAIVTLILAGCNPGAQYTVPVNFTAASAYRAIPSQTIQVGDLRADVGYTWQLFAGHAATGIQLHFANVHLSDPNSRLTIMDAQGNTLDEYHQTNRADHWTPVYPTTLLQWRLDVNEPEENAQESFRIDTVQVFTGLEKWFENNPAGQFITTGASPNVHLLQHDLAQANREVYGVLPPDGENYYTGDGLFPGMFNFSVVGSPTGTPDVFNTSDVLYSRSNRAVRSCRMGDEDGGSDEFDDVTVFTSTGEVFIALSRGENGFPAFGLARRGFVGNAPAYACGRINGDELDDLVALTNDGVTYALHDGTSGFPGFGPSTSVSLPPPPAGTVRQLLGDFDGDGFADILRVVDVANETGQPSPTTSDYIRVFRNDQAGGFVDYATWYRSGIGNTPVGYERRFFAGRFNKDARDDVLIVDLPLSDTERRVTFKVALNAIGNAPGSEFSLELWTDFDLPAPSADGAYPTIDEVIVGDFGGDDRTDVMMRWSRGRRVIGGGRAFTTVEAPLRLIGMIAETDPILFMPDFGPATDWGPPIMPAGRLLAGRFRDTRLSDLLDIDANPQTTLARLDNQNVATGGATPQARFTSATERLYERPIYVWGDVDGDHRDDLVEFTADLRGSVEVLRSVPGGLERGGAPWRTQFARNFRSLHERPLLGDVNGDAYADLVLFVDDTPSFANNGAAIAPSVFVALNTTTGSFGPFQRWNTLLAPTLTDRTPVLGDFNGDGKDDAAIIYPHNASTDFFLAYSSGTAFGPASGAPYDALYNLGGLTNVARAVAAKVDDDSRDDVVLFDLLPEPQRTRGNVFSLRPTSSGVSKIHEMSFSFPGVTRTGLHFAAGRLTGTRAGGAMYLDTGQAPNNAALMTWLPTSTGEWMDVGPSYIGLSADSLTQTDAVDLIGLGREELCLIQPDAASSLFRIVRTSVRSSDLDLFVKTYTTSPTRAPTEPWTATSARPLVSEELADRVPMPNHRFALRVLNKGADPAVYRLLSDHLQSSQALDLLMMSENPVPRSLFDHTLAMAEDAPPRFLDATDGMRNFSAFRLWASADGDVGAWKDAIEDCDDEIDGYVFNYDDRADARSGCFMRLYLNDDGGVLVHEFGHYGFGLDDEYCEGPFDCGLKSGVGIHDTEPLCPSLMAASGLPDFCTSGNHQRQGLINDQASPSWYSVTPPFLYFLAPTDTPNLYDYRSVIFGRMYWTCLGDC